MNAPDLNQLAAFEAVARRRSFRRAAAERGVSPSSLSQAVRELEARLGVRLLNRTTRSVAPTDAGQRLLEQLSPALADIASAVDQLQAEPGEVAGVLRINAPEPAAELVLAPMITPFLSAHPRVRLELITQSALIDIVAEGFDAGVRWSESLAQDMVSVPLRGADRAMLAAAPSLIDRVGAPETPNDLLRLPCIRTRYLSGVTPPWEFEHMGQPIRLDPPAVLITSNVAVQRRAALDGLGFWMSFADDIGPLVEAGRLVSVLDDWQETFTGPYLYYPSRRHTPPALRAFIDFAKAWRGPTAAGRPFDTSKRTG